MPPDKRRIALLALTLALLCGIFFFGLRPGDFTPDNNAHWLEDQNGVRFGKYAIAYSPAFMKPAGGRFSNESGISIEIALQPDRPYPSHFSFILVVDNGIDAEQLLVGQWRSWIILMNGDDYAHRKRSKRLSINSDALAGGIVFLTIVSGPDGTRLYANGRLMSADRDLVLKMPSGAPSRLILANSAYGRHPWQGRIYALAIYTHRLGPEIVSAHYHQWSQDGHFGRAVADGALAAYDFNSRKGQSVRDRSGTAHLEMPRNMRVLRPPFLVLPRVGHQFDLMDVILNFVAFVPLGAVLTAFLQRCRGCWQRSALPLAAGICVLASMAIETTQAWVPSRSSTLLDLILNSAGGLSGALAYAMVCTRRHRLRPDHANSRRQ